MMDTDHSDTGKPMTEQTQSIRTITIRAQTYAIYPPPLEMWAALNAVETDDEKAQVYPWGWTIDVLDAVTRHCAKKSFEGRPDELAILVYAILKTWDQSYWHIAMRTSFVRNALALYLAGTIANFFRIELAL